jgi:hypothetical protein
MAMQLIGATDMTAGLAPGFKLWAVFFENDPDTIWAEAAFQRLQPNGDLYSQGIVAYLPNFSSPSGLHPSAPNYTYYAAGKAWLSADTGCGTAGSHPTLATLLDFASVSVGEFMEDYPNDAACDTTGGACDKNDNYCCKHDPFNLFSNVPAAVCKRIRTFATGTTITGPLADTLSTGGFANFGYISPNIKNDGHDDASLAGPWLDQFLKQLLDSPEFKSGVLQVAITFDENDGSATANTTRMAFIGKKVKGGTYNTSWETSSWVATVEKIFTGATGQLNQGDKSPASGTMESLFSATK